MSKWVDGLEFEVGNLEWLDFSSDVNIETGFDF